MNYIPNPVQPIEFPTRSSNSPTQIAPAFCRETKEGSDQRTQRADIRMAGQNFIPIFIELMLRKLHFRRLIFESKFARAGTV
jgi:hypothetical protein